MQPTPMAGFVLAKEKKESDVVKLGFELPQKMGSERDAALCEIIAVGPHTLEQTEKVIAGAQSGAGVSEFPHVRPGDIVAYAPFSAMKIRVGTDEWLFIEFKHLMGNFGKVTKEDSDV